MISVGSKLIVIIREYEYVKTPNGITHLGILQLVASLCKSTSLDRPAPRIGAHQHPRYNTHCSVACQWGVQYHAMAYDALQVINIWLSHPRGKSITPPFNNSPYSYCGGLYNLNKRLRSIRDVFKVSKVRLVPNHLRQCHGKGSPDSTEPRLKSMLNAEGSHGTFRIG